MAMMAHGAKIQAAGLYWGEDKTRGVRVEVRESKLLYRILGTWGDLNKLSAWQKNKILPEYRT